MKSDGLLLVDKESGVTSHDVVARFRRAARIKKVGHTGTLDPLATGLLILCVGNATRLQSYLTSAEKTYEGEIQFGWATDTYDSAGTPAGESVAAEVTNVDFEPLLEPLRGEIEQMPPSFSAKKVAGVRAYELARRGEATNLTPKRVHIYELQILAIAESVASFRVRCSAGTYVRSIAHDLGVSLGTGAHLKSLRRTAIGRYNVRDAVPSTLVSELERDQLFMPAHFRSMNEIDLPLAGIQIDPMQQQKLLRGNEIVVKPAVEIVHGQQVAIRNVNEELVAIGIVKEVLRPGGPVVILPKVALTGGA